MTHHRISLRLATAIVAGGATLATAPALAQGSAPDPTVYTFSVPGSVTVGSGKLSLPGDVVTSKARGAKDLGKVSLVDMVVRITSQADKGASVAGLFTVKGRTLHMRGLPVVTDDGNVKVRVAQGRGTRTLVLPRKSGSGSTSVCVAPNVAQWDATLNRYVCEPLP